MSWPCLLCCPEDVRWERLWSEDVYRSPWCSAESENQRQMNAMDQISTLYNLKRFAVVQIVTY